MTVHARELNWQTAKAPSLAEIEALAWVAFAAMPAQFRELCGDVVILIDDVADAETLAEVGIENELELSGLFSGVARPYQESSNLPRTPNTVHLYRVPILLEWAETDVTLGELVSHVLIHEIAHHFGFSDDGIHAVEESGD